MPSRARRGRRCRAPGRTRSTGRRGVPVRCPAGRPVAFAEDQVVGGQMLSPGDLAGGVSPQSSASAVPPGPLPRAAVAMSSGLSELAGQAGELHMIRVLKIDRATNDAAAKSRSATPRSEFAWTTTTCSTGTPCAFSRSMRPEPVLVELEGDVVDRADSARAACGESPRRGRCPARRPARPPPEEGQHVAAAGGEGVLAAAGETDGLDQRHRSRTRRRSPPSRPCRGRRGPGG